MTSLNRSDFEIHQQLDAKIDYGAVNDSLGCATTVGYEEKGSGRVLEERGQARLAFAALMSLLLVTAVDPIRRVTM